MKYADIRNDPRRARRFVYIAARQLRREGGRVPGWFFDIGKDSSYYALEMAASARYWKVWQRP